VSDRPRVINFPGLSGVPSANDVPKEGWQDMARKAVEILRDRVERAITEGTPISVVSVVGVTLPNGAYTAMTWANESLPGAIGLVQIAINDTLNGTVTGTAPAPAG